MRKLNIYIISLLIVIILAFLFYNIKVKNNIIEKDYNVILKTNCDIGLES